MKQKIEFLTSLHEIKLEHASQREKDLKEAHNRELELVKEKQAIPTYPYPHLYPHPHAQRFIGSSILPLHLEQHLVNWTGSAHSHWNLIYRASTHGDSAATFHTLCDNKPCTLLLVKVGGFIFGGYNTACWNSATNNYCNAPGSFLFTLINPFGDPPTLFSCKSLAHSIYCNTGYGPSFGSGHDLHISNSSRSVNNNYCNLNNSYNDTLGRGANTFTGARNFTVTDYEVFIRA